MTKLSAKKEIALLYNGQISKEFSSRNDYWKLWRTIYKDNELVIDVRVENGLPKIVSVGQDAFIEVENHEIYRLIYKAFPGVEEIELEDWFPQPFDNWEGGSRALAGIKILSPKSA